MCFLKLFREVFYFLTHYFEGGILLFDVETYRCARGNLTTSVFLSPCCDELPTEPPPIFFDSVNSPVKFIKLTGFRVCI
jgi:hypothetical protein